LAEVATLAAKGDSFDRCLAKFLDGFYASPTSIALDKESGRLDGVAADAGRIHDAYLAATSKELARTFHFPSPKWARHEGRQLHRPWFASPLASLRAVLLQESPPAFRCWNLFVSGNALSRA
jgi:hypothetical protein